MKTLEIACEKGTGSVAKTPKGMYYMVTEHNRGISDIYYEV